MSPSRRCSPPPSVGLVLRIAGDPGLPASSPRSASSRASAAPSTGRSSGFLASIRATRTSRRGSTPGSTVERRGAGSRTMRTRPLNMSSPSNGGRSATHVKSRHAERVDIGGGRAFAEASRLFGRHVMRRPDHHPGDGDRRFVVVLHPSNAEIDDLRAREVAPLEEDVARLEIAVDDAEGVGDAEAGGDASDEGERVVHRQRAALQAGAEILPVEPLHRDPVTPAVATVGHVADDRVVAERGEEPRFALESFRAPTIGRAEELDGDGLTGRAIPGAEHGAHRARARKLPELEAIPEDVHPDAEANIEACRARASCPLIGPCPSPRARRYPRRRSSSRHFRRIRRSPVGMPASPRLLSSAPIGRARAMTSGVSY